MRKVLFSLFLGALGVASIACGGGGNTGTGGAGGSTGTGGSTGISGEQACSDFASARCARLAACSNGRQITALYGDLATCEGRTKLGCLTSLDAPSTGRTPESTKACAEALPGEACADLFDNNPVPACKPESGDLANGAGCGFSGQCQSAFCNVPKGAICGTCMAEPAAGAPCTQDNDCSDGQICPKATAVCTAPAAMGTACSKDVPCASGLSCLGASPTVNGSCVAAASSIGAACDPKKDTAPGCDRKLGLSCDAATNTCAAIAYAADGAPCGTVGGAEVDCVGGGLCVIPSGQTQGVCSAPAADGAACDTDAGPPCLLPSRCVATTPGGTAGTCAAPTGASCP